jgi:hypothetical protein
MVDLNIKQQVEITIIGYGGNGGTGFIEDDFGPMSTIPELQVGSGGTKYNYGGGGGGAYLKVIFYSSFFIKFENKNIELWITIPYGINEGNNYKLITINGGDDGPSYSQPTPTQSGGKGGTITTNDDIPEQLLIVYNIQDSKDGGDGEQSLSSNNSNVSPKGGSPGESIDKSTIDYGKGGNGSDNGNSISGVQPYIQVCYQKYVPPDPE